MKNKKVEWMVKVAMLSAVAAVLMLIEVPLPFIAPPFYKLDLSEVPVLIGAFALGPMAGVVIEALKVILNLIINGTVTGGVGELANFVIGVAYVLPASCIYKIRRTKKSAVFGLIVGGATMVVLGCFINAYIMLPAYGQAFKMPIDAFVKMGTAIWPAINNMFTFVVFCVAPFNAVKVIIVSIITIILYKHLSPLLKVKK